MILGPRRRLAGLDLLCATLTGQALAGAGGGSDRPRPVDWQHALAVADELRVDSVLWPAVGPIRDQIPRPLAEEIRERHRAALIRNLRFRDGLADAVRALNDAGIVPTLLKGAAEVAGATDSAMRARAMADLDLLVAPLELSAATAALTEIGYRRRPGNHPWVFWEHQFFKRGMPGAIDLHVAIGGPAVRALMPDPLRHPESIEVRIADGRARLPSPNHQVVHSVVHSAVQELDHAVGNLPLRQLLTLTSIARRHGEAIDWPAIQDRMTDHGLGAYFTDHLWLAHRFAGLDLPPLSGRWRARARIHESRVRVSFAMAWPSDLQFNLRQAFGHEYLDFVYGHGGRPIRLARARVEHAARLMRLYGRQGLRRAMRPKN